MSRKLNDEIELLRRDHDNLRRIAAEYYAREKYGRLTDKMLGRQTEEEKSEAPAFASAFGHQSDALQNQVGGTHYHEFKIQPIEFIMKNKLSYGQGNVIKYVCRYLHKNGVEDLRKAKHYIEFLIEEALENG